jgi:hypothetical protein
MRNNLTRYPVCCCTNVAALRLATPGSAAPVVTAPNTSPNTDTSTSSLRMASSSNSDDVTTGSTRVPRSLSASTRTFLDRIVNEDSGLHKHCDLALPRTLRRCNVAYPVGQINPGRQTNPLRLTHPGRQNHPGR